MSELTCTHCYKETLKDIKSELNWYKKETNKDYIMIAYPKPKLIIDFNKLAYELRKEFKDLSIDINSTLTSEYEFLLTCSL